MTASRACFEGPCALPLYIESNCREDGCRFSSSENQILIPFKVMDYGQAGLVARNPVEPEK